MKSALLAFAFLLSTVSFAQKVDLPTAKFITGDNIAYGYPSWEDTKWMDIKSGLPWEQQGLGTYDGYAWYRFHLFVPHAIKDNSLWKDSLRIFIGNVDDACEVFMNGTRIGKSGSFPEEKAGYITTWNKPIEIHLAANTPFFSWGGENILSVRVYDGGGNGGLFGSIPYVNMMDLIDKVRFDNNSPVQFTGTDKAKKNIAIHNTFNQTINGKLHYSIIDLETDNMVKDSISISIKPNAIFNYTIPINITGRNKIMYEFVESRSHKSIQETETIPYILTPPTPALPMINGATVFGVRPNSPLLFKIPATGKKPLSYSVENLPQGLTINAVTGIITGSLKNKGDNKMMLVVKNSLGIAKKAFTIKCGDLLALTPPMGWNSWNCWGLSVSDEKLRISAKAMIDKGLIDHGWTYMNIDDGWEAQARNNNGTIIANNKFPDMKKLGEWLHSNGLRFGIYSSPGSKTCGDFLGSYQHEEQDATTYANWGIDYLKYDWCSYGDIHDKNDSSLESYKKPYQVMQQALQKQDRDIVYSLCQYGMKNVWEWGASVNGNCWRTTGDIEDSWQSLSSIGFNQTKQQAFAAPGRWNDPDMMIVGQLGWGDHLHATRLTPDEQYTHMSLWSLLSAPLLIGCDLSKLDDFTLNLLTNDEVIAIDQDPLGKQAQLVLKTDAYQVWVKDLEDGNKAVGIFNLSNKDDVIRFYWNNLRLTNNYKVRDLWRQKDLGKFASMFSTRVVAHGVTLIKITAF